MKKTLAIIAVLGALALYFQPADIEITADDVLRQVMKPEPLVTPEPPMTAISGGTVISTTGGAYGCGMTTVPTMTVAAASTTSVTMVATACSVPTMVIPSPPTSEE